MKQTKKITLSAMTVALGTLFMVLGAVIQVMDLTVAMLSSLLVAFVYIELGSPYTYLVWIGTALATFILYPGNLMWLSYLVLFGIYPIIKGYIERLPKTFWIILKIIFANIAFTLILFLSVYITGIPLLSDMPDIPWLPDFAMYILLYILGNFAFFLYDFLISMLVKFYFVKIRPKIKRILK